MTMLPFLINQEPIGPNVGVVSDFEAVWVVFRIPPLEERHVSNAMDGNRDLFIRRTHPCAPNLCQTAGDAWAAQIAGSQDLPGKLNNAFKDFGLSGVSPSFSPAANGGTGGLAAETGHCLWDA
jgi:hypothetical protein